MHKSIFSIIVHIVITCTAALTTINATAATLIRSEMQGWSWHQSSVLAGFLRASSGRQAEPLAIYSSAPTRAIYAQLWRAQGKSKGLYLFLPGTGSDPQSTGNGLLAEQISDAGYDLIVLPSPFSETFQRTFTDGYIGIPRRDLASVLEMIESAVHQFEVYNGRTREVNLIGFSLGGMYTALIASGPSAGRFNKFIAINPPLNFEYAIGVIDQMIRMALAEQRVTLFDLAGDLVKILSRTRRGIDLSNMAVVQQSIGNDETVNEQLIGTAFQMYVKTIVHHGRKFRTFPVDYGSAERMTLTDYMNFLGKTVVPRVSELRGKTVHQLASELNLVNGKNRLKSAVRLSVITTTDDMLNTPQALRAADQTLGRNLIIFDKGGHGGYMWTPSFRQVLRGLL